jgi:hypothetical protein
MRPSFRCLREEGLFDEYNGINSVHFSLLRNGESEYGKPAEGKSCLFKKLG